MARPDELKEILASIRQHAGVLALIRALCHDAQVRRFWLTAPRDLLPVISVGDAELVLPLLTDSTTLALPPSDLAAVLGSFDALTARREAQHDVTTFRLIDWLRSARPMLTAKLIHLIATFWRTNPAYVELLREPELDDALVSRIVGQNPPNLEGLAPWLEGEADRFGQRTDVHRKILTESLEWIPEFRFKALLSTMHFADVARLRGVLHRLGLQVDWYAGLLESLLAGQLLARDFGSVLFCGNCGPAETLMLTSVALEPRRLRAFRCVRCGLQLHGATVFPLVAQLHRILTFRDGILAVLFAFILESCKVGYSFSESVDGTEHDFLLHGVDASGDVLVETKMHQLPEGPRGADGALRKDLNQARKHRDLLRKHGRSVSQAFVLRNFRPPPPKHKNASVLTIDDVLEGRLFPVHDLSHAIGWTGRT